MWALLFHSSTHEVYIIICLKSSGFNANSGPFDIWASGGGLVFICFNIPHCFMIEAYSLKVIDGWFWWKKPKQGYENCFFQLSNLPWSVFVLGNPTYWGLETAVHPIFANLVLGILLFVHWYLGQICPICNGAIYAQNVKIAYCGRLI